MASAPTAQKAFLNNFENVLNCRVDIQEDIKCYQDTLRYASSKVDYSMGENIYMMPSDMNMNVKTGTAGYSNKILVSHSGFSLGRNDIVNTSAQRRRVIRHLLFRSIHPCQRLLTKKSCPRQNTPQPSCTKRKLSLWYSLWLLRDTRRGVP